MVSEYSEKELDADIISFFANVNANPQLAEQLSIKIANVVSNGTIELLKIVLSLRENLTSSEDSMRDKAMCCLASVLEHISKSTLKKNDVRVILDFLSSKMDDPICVKEALKGVASVVNMKCFYSSQLADVLNLLSKKYTPSNFLAATRYFAFDIMQSLLDRFRETMVADDALNDLYLATFIGIATGEKDPRNLMLSFSLNSQITSSLTNIGKYKEDLFDILFCYFPIMFKPPSNDPYKITNSDLKLSLRSAISATEKFDDDAFGNLVDKLTASSPSVKNDTILTINDCLRNFSGISCLKHWLPIWQALKFEIINNVDQEASPLSTIIGDEETNTNITKEDFNNYEDALSVLGTISEKLITFEEAAFDRFLIHIFDDLMITFKQEKDMRQTCDILSSIAAANLTTFNKVLTKALPVLLDNKDLDLNKQKLLLLNLSSFFVAYIKVFGETGMEVPKFSAQNKLLDRKDDILIILSKALTGTNKTEVTIRTLAVMHFTTLAKMSGYLEDQEISMVVQFLTETILIDDNKNIYFACLEGLKQISSSFENIVFEVCLKQLLGLLPFEFEETIVLKNTETISLDRIFRVILDFTTSRHQLVKESMLGIFSKLCEVAPRPNSRSYVFLLVSTLLTLFENNFDDFDQATLRLLKDTVESDFLKIIKTCESIYEDDHTLVLASDILFYLNIKTDVKKHGVELQAFVRLLMESKVLECPSRSIVIFAHVFASFDKNCEFYIADDSLKKILTLCRETNVLTTFESLCYLEFVALLVNKWISDEMVAQLIDLDDISLNNLELICWVTKGLVMRNSPLGSKYTKFLFELLGDEKLGAKVARFFEILVVDLPIFRKFKGLTYNNNVRLLYKQKFFSEVAHQMVASFKSTNNMLLKSNYLTALSLVLKNTPNTITISYVASLLPLLLEALALENTDVKISALKTLKDSLEQASTLFTEHVHSLIPILLNLTKPSRTNIMEVRLLSLEILKLLTIHVPLNYLQPFKSDIVRKLQAALGDKKRFVRKQCVDTKQAFLELGQVPFD